MIFPDCVAEARHAVTGYGALANADYVASAANYTG
jgi:hypothetical protein